MRAYEFAVPKKLYHGSSFKLPVGKILIPRPGYEDRWSHTDFFGPLEFYRPPNKLSHAQSVFMCDNPIDVGMAGGGQEWLFTVIPIGPVQRHDMNWSSEISSLVELGYDLDSPEIVDAAEAYWNGEPSANEVIWEYLAPKAKIIKVEKY